MRFIRLGRHGGEVARIWRRGCPECFADVKRRRPFFVSTWTALGWVDTCLRCGAEYRERFHRHGVDADLRGRSRELISSARQRWRALPCYPLATGSTPNGAR